MNRIDFRPNRGLSALLLTVILSLIMVIFIVGLTVISTRELRQSSQLDQSARALYGAEAGVQDALTKLSQDPSFTEDCPAPGGIPTQLNVSNYSDNLSSDQIAWVCRTVGNSGSQVEGTLSRDNAAQFNLTQYKMPNNSDKVTHIKVEYANPSPGSSFQVTNLADCFYPRFPANTNCSNGTGYNPWTAPPAIELGLVWWPRGNGVQIYNEPNGIIGLPVRNILVMPAKDDQPQSNSGVKSDCNSARQYNCILRHGNSNLIPLNTVTSTSGDQNWIFRLRPRYTGTNYRLTFYSCGNDDQSCRVNVRFPFAVIDVTGRSGDTYRRIKAYKPLIPDTIYNNLDNVLVSGTEICKNLIVDINHNGVGPNGGRNFCNGRNY